LVLRITPKLWETDILLTGIGVEKSPIAVMTISARSADAKVVHTEMLNSMLITSDPKAKAGVIDYRT